MSDTVPISPLDRLKRARKEEEQGSDANSDTSEKGDERSSKRQNVEAANDTQDQQDISEKPSRNNGEGHRGSDRSQSTVSIRAVVNTKEAGIVIGKRGKNISEIRERSGARVTVSDIVPGALDRILTATGTLEDVAQAFEMIAAQILGELGNSASSPGICTLRLLIPDSRMGSVIGKRGAKIRELQESSSARVQASEMRMPMSTERTLTITGTTDAISTVVFKVAEILRDHVERSTGTIPYHPQPNPSQYPAYPMAMAMPEPLPPPAGGMAPDYIPGHFYYGAGYGPPIPAMTAPQTHQMFIPEDMVGAIIGKAGMKINDIRQRSGCQIKIAPADPSAGERLVTITGTAEGNQMALYLIYNRMQGEKTKHPYA
ncbi:hypothetical protein BZG36_01787 [Bifiguratus adelaidae]|uniref:K Homology domain-containing protein n=1 Tax=Bifiguratus adelaidae TaxID=1938954 RepID=A0A261Y2B8_9FUNG|nr:hypothetical protein BZG36_01787 [Bifiguratus adelaidae]